VELRHIRYFVAAVEEGSLLGAAKRMHVTQPAMSRQISDLETMLGCLLFERRARGVRLTPAGVSFHRDALAMLQIAEGATQRSRRIGLEQQQRVRLGVVRTASKYPFVERALARFRRKHPHVSVEFVRAGSPELVEALRDGQLDMALIYERQLDPRAFNQRVVHCESYVLAIHPSHRLASQRSIHLSDIAGEPLVWQTRRTNADHHDALLQQFRVHGLEPVIGHQAESHDEQMEVLAMTSGVCLTIPSTQLSVAPGKLVFRLIADFDLEIQLRLAWRKGLPTGSASALQKSLAAAIDDHQAELVSGAQAWTRVRDGHVVARCPGLATVRQ
jgi:DNA-binding transcriptional LysR family regulator